MKRIMKLTSLLIGVTLIVFAVASFSAGISSQPIQKVYKPTHESIASYDVPAWYSEGKLGVFMHLSAFSVPAYKNEWYARNMYYAEDVQAMNDPNNPSVAAYNKSFRDYHGRTYGPLNESGYKDFIPMLKLEKFDADYYADLVKKSGATYFAAPAVHHDGFAMWDSEVIDWNAAKMGPMRDVVGELTEAMRSKGIKSGGDDNDPLPSRYQLKNPLPYPKGGEWFKEAGLGLFIHWGPASVPDIEDVWRIRQPVEGSDPPRPKVTPQYYYDNAPKGFTAENYDPEKWMAAAAKVGFRYAVLTSKHHDGYALWPSELSNMGVRTFLDGRDLLQPYVDALRGNNMKVGFYFSGVDWWQDRDYMNYYFNRGEGNEGWDFQGKPLAQDAVETLTMDIVERKKKMAFEVMERYAPDIWWWDSGLPVTYEETAMKYNTDMIFNNRGNFYHEGRLKGTYPGSHYVTPEGFHSLEWRHVKKLIEHQIPWEICMTFQLSGWFYFSPRGEETVALEDVMYALARVRSWNGNLLLNISPRADGTLPDKVYENLEKMARWMEWGEVSMFNTKGTHFPEKSNVPVTTSVDGKTWWLQARPGAQHDYAQWGIWKKAYYEGTEPGKPIRVNDLPKVKSVSLLRTGDSVKFTYEDGVLVIPNPDAGPDGLHEVLEVKF